MEPISPVDPASNPLPSTSATAPSFVDHEQLAKAVNLEFDRSTKLLDFLQGQADKDRNFYKHLFTFTGTFLGLLTAAAAYFQFSSVSQMRADIAATAKSALDANRAALDALQAQANATQAQAMATMNRELISASIKKRKSASGGKIIALVLIGRRRHANHRNDQSNRRRPTLLFRPKKLFQSISSRLRMLACTTQKGTI